MKNITIRLESTDEIMDFNKIITKYNCDFDLEVGHNYVDAKSLLGLYSLSLNKPMTLHIQADNELFEEIVGKLETFVYREAVAC